MNDPQTPFSSQSLPPGTGPKLVVHGWPRTIHKTKHVVSYTPPKEGKGNPKACSKLQQ